MHKDIQQVCGRCRIVAVSDAKGLSAVDESVFANILGEAVVRQYTPSSNVLWPMSNSLRDASEARSSRLPQREK